MGWVVMYFVIIFAPAFAQIALCAWYDHKIDEHYEYEPKHLAS